MSKTLERLIERAERNGEAILNGRMWEYRQYSELQEKYAIEIDGNELRLRHWGTETLHINTKKQTILSWYGESKSDVDSMNYVLGRYGIEGNFRYRPSIDEFYLD